MELAGAGAYNLAIQYVRAATLQKVAAVNFHQQIGAVVKQFHNPPEVTVRLDWACEPFGCQRRHNRQYLQGPSRSTCLCCVDIQIDHRDRPIVMIEIEDRGNNGPFKISGKLGPIFIAEVSKASGKNVPAVRLHGLTMVQIICIDYLKPKAFKPEQYNNIEKRIQHLLPLGCVHAYHLIAGGGTDFMPGGLGFDRLCEVLRNTPANMGIVDLD